MTLSQLPPPLLAWYRANARDLPWRRVDSPTWDQFRPGDLVEYDNDLDGHVIVVVSKTVDTITFTDSGPT